MLIWKELKKVSHVLVQTWISAVHSQCLVTLAPAPLGQSVAFSPVKSLVSNSIKLFFYFFV